MLCSLDFDFITTRLFFLLAPGRFSVVSLVNPALPLHTLKLGIPPCSLILFSHCILLLRDSICAENLNYCLYVAESHPDPSVPDRSSENHTHEFGHLFDISAKVCSLNSICPQREVFPLIFFFFLKPYNLVSGNIIHPVSHIRNSVIILTPPSSSSPSFLH